MKTLSDTISVEMSEHCPYRGPWTIIDVTTIPENPERILVPFSKPEINAILRAHELHGQMEYEARKEVGIIRDLYQGTTIPWGMGLSCRETAIEQMIDTAAIYEDVLNDKSYNVAINGFRPSLTEMYITFRNFL